jgi:hypothetical protein
MKRLSVLMRKGCPFEGRNLTSSRIVACFSGIMISADKEAFAGPDSDILLKTQCTP